jgi:hypothetical protein
MAAVDGTIGENVFSRAASEMNAHKPFSIVVNEKETRLWQAIPENKRDLCTEAIVRLFVLKGLYFVLHTVNCLCVQY